MLCKQPNELAKINSQIRAITVAASHYGLIIRGYGSPQLVALDATPLLHLFFITLGTRNIAAMRALFAAADDALI